MKKFILSGMAALASMSLLVSCSDDWGVNSSEAVGHISPSFDLDKETISSRSQDPTSQSANLRATEITVADLSLRLTKADGTYSHEWAKIADFPVEQDFAIGDYTLEAFYGDVAQQGFDLPSYSGSQTITVMDGQTTKPSITATMSKSMVTIQYTDAFQKYMSDWSAEVNGIAYVKDESRPVYITPGDAVIRIKVTKPNGMGGEFTLDKIEAKARYHYVVTVDVNEGNVGDATLTVTFDDNLINEDIDIDISDLALSSPAPTATANGFTSDVTFSFVAGTPSSTPLTVDLMALAGLKEVTMKTSSASLLAQGWPAEINLIGATAQQQSQLTGLGFSVLGLWRNPAEMAVVDFTKVLEHIRTVAGTDNVTTITVTVKDKLMRESSPVTLSLTTEDVMLTLDATGTVYDPGENIDVTLSYNGGDVKKDVVFKYHNPATNTYRDLTIVNVAPKSRTMTDYVVTLATPTLDVPLTVRAESGSVKSNEVKIDFASMAVEVAADNVFATYVLAKVVGLNDSPAPESSKWTFLAKSSAETSFSTVEHEMVGEYAKVKGLAPATKYTIKASIDGVGSKGQTVTTEAAPGVPNGDFESLTNQRTGQLNMGGTWNTILSSSSSFQNTAEFTISEPSQWATTNAKTMTRWTNGNTWFNMPSVFNSTLSWTSHKDGSLLAGAASDGHPASFTGFTAYEGSNAMVVRNVAWDANETTIARVRNTGYNNTVPNISNVSVGKMFLGTYSYADGTETYTQGISFAGRPTALTGYYLFKPDNGDTSDYGVVTVEILSGDQVIASGKAQLAEASSYQQFSIALTYAMGAPKATSLRIMVASSSHASTDMASETANVKVTTYNSTYESYKHGATLVVDDFKFVY